MAIANGGTAGAHSLSGGGEQTQKPDPEADPPAKPDEQNSDPPSHIVAMIERRNSLRDYFAGGDSATALLATVRLSSSGKTVEGDIDAWTGEGMLDLMAKLRDAIETDQEPETTVGAPAAPLAGDHEHDIVEDPESHSRRCRICKVPEWQLLQKDKGG